VQMARYHDFKGNELMQDECEDLHAIATMSTVENGMA
jgi:hypothetical protein